MSNFDDSLNLDESAYQPGSAHSPVTLISNDFLPQGVTVGNVVAYQTPMVVETPALHHDSSDYIHDAVESINQMRSGLEARLHALEDKLEVLITNIHRGVSGSTSPAGDHPQGTTPVQSCGPEQDTPDIKLGQALPTHNMIILSHDQLEKIINEKVTMRLIEFQKSLYDQTYAEVRLRNLESSLDSINKSITTLSAHTAPFPPNQATIRPSNLIQHNASEANDVYPATYNQRAARPGMISLDMSTQNSHRPNSVQNLYDVVESGQTNLSALAYSATSRQPNLYKSSSTGDTTSSVMRKSYVPNSIVQTPVSHPTLGMLSQNTGTVQDIINEIRHRSGIQVST
ncbi:Hypothetical protein GLP15_3504 [Giardia lamblia P15]|uniref:Uncharacterized protein n=1 Tax=Giardia intestinalis (strain P15) TaxID=658858 RepID=E1EVQ3_GIAIA|nr:Hypothetical protein GLP15_3504 [Giardia lamblia P15]